MKEYLITFNVSGLYETIVKAETEEEAIAMAETNFSDSDLGELYYIDGDVHSIECESENYIKYID